MFYFLSTINHKQGYELLVSTVNNLPVLFFAVFTDQSCPRKETWLNARIGKRLRPLGGRFPLGAFVMCSWHALCYLFSDGDHLPIF
jgi:hypothetical protein